MHEDTYRSSAVKPTPSAGGATPKPNWQTQSGEQVARILATDLRGLTDDEAALRLKQYGPNALRQKKAKGVGSMLIEQLTSPMMVILIGAAFLSFVLGENVEGIVLLVMVAVNTIVSIVQEKKAAGALDALKNIGAPAAYALREGEWSSIPANDVVPGDIVHIESGTIVPADIRLIEASELKMLESSLTGESMPVTKQADECLATDTPLADRTNMVFSSTIVAFGTGKGIVVGTGMNTEVGQIAHMLDRDEDEDNTPMKRKLDAAGKTLTLAGLVICIVIFVIGSLYGRPWLPLLMTAISLAISVIPEGLPATATIVMAFGVQRMAQKNALVRNLPAVETLGSTTVICTDKTGTLTQNRMTVTQIALCEDFAAGDVVAIEQATQTPDKYRELLSAGVLCNNARQDPDRDGETLGDPTEGALLSLAVQFGWNVSSFTAEHKRVFEQPFSSKRKRMTTANQTENGIVAYTKGAVDELLPVCTHILDKGGERVITDEDRASISRLCERMSDEALRVLGFASRKLTEIPAGKKTDLEHDLCFLGVTGMIDPPRLEVADAIKVCKQAGIRTLMITGDHEVTATAIARQLGIYEEGNTALTGKQMHSMSTAQLDEAMKTTTVFARVSPLDKMVLVRSLRRGGEVIAMTGDGVNDAPALKMADIGIAMGDGTDVAKEAADMVLLDDNFTTIEYAIHEGRRIYRNIQKVIQFLLAGNVAEVLTLFTATLLNWEAPLLAVHVLLVNLITDSLPAIALGVDPAERNIMQQTPVRGNSLFDRGLVARIAVNGIFITFATLLAYQLGTGMGGHTVGMTMAFLVLAISQLLHALTQRSNIDSVFARGNGHNKALVVTMAISAAALALVMAVPSLRGFFSLIMLTGAQWVLALVISCLPLACAELVKLCQRLSRDKKAQ